MVRSTLIAVTLASIVSALVATTVTYFFLEPSGSTRNGKIESIDVEVGLESERPKEPAEVQTAAAPDKQKPKSRIIVPHIELDDFIKLFMLPAEASHNLLDWNTGNEPGTPISWEHEGIKTCEEFKQRASGPAFCRRGSVVITVNGEPTHTVLGRTVEPGRWTITLEGARGGYDSISLESNLGEELPLDGASRAGIEITSLGDCGRLTDGHELLRLDAAGKQPIFMHTTRSCGAALCTGWYTLAYDEKRAEALHAQACAQSSG